MTCRIIQGDPAADRRLQRDNERTDRYALAYARHCGDAVVATRREAIAALPQKMWKGRHVYRFVCWYCGGERWESEYIGWVLLSLEHYMCRWCMLGRGKRLAQPVTKEMFA